MIENNSTDKKELENKFASVSGFVRQVEKAIQKKTKKTAPRITLRLTEEENSRLKNLSQGITVSAYIRKCVFGENTTRRKHRSYRPVQDQESMAKALGLLGQSRIANNLNQLAHQANMQSLVMDEVTLEKINEAAFHIAYMRTELIRALGLKDK